MMKQEMDRWFANEGAELWDAVEVARRSLAAAVNDSVGAPDMEVAVERVDTSEAALSEAWEAHRAAFLADGSAS